MGEVNPGSKVALLLLDKKAMYATCMWCLEFVIGCKVEANDYDQLVIDVPDEIHQDEDNPEPAHDERYPDPPN